MNATTEIFEFKVKLNAGAYVTSTVRGHRASSTTSAKRAAQTLALKLIPDRGAVVMCHRVEKGVEIWRAFA